MFYRIGVLRSQITSLYTVKRVYLILLRGHVGEVNIELPIANMFVRGSQSGEGEPIINYNVSQFKLLRAEGRIKSTETNQVAGSPSNTRQETIPRSFYLWRPRAHLNVSRSVLSSADNKIINCDLTFHGGQDRSWTIYI